MKRTLMIFGRLIVVLFTAGVVHLMARVIWWYGLRDEYRAWNNGWDDSRLSFDGAGLFTMIFAHILGIIAVVVGVVILVAAGSWILFGFGPIDPCKKLDCTCKRHKLDQYCGVAGGALAGLAVAGFGLAWLVASIN